MTDSELRVIINPLFVPCPVCKARPGKKCHFPTPHHDRVEESIRRAKEILPLEIAED